MRSWWKGYSAEEESAALEDLRASYDEFVARVAAARSLEPADVDARLARGRVFSGVRAAELGLVDSYGGLREAVLRARIMAGLRGRELDVRVLPEPPGLLQQVRSLFGLKIPSLGREALGREASGAATDWTRLLPAPLLATLRQIPAPLWLAAEPEPMALDPDQLAIE
jgi:protease-4